MNYPAASLLTGRQAAEYQAIFHRYIVPRDGVFTRRVIIRENLSVEIPWDEDGFVSQRDPVGVIRGNKK